MENLIKLRKAQQATSQEHRAVFAVGCKMRGRCGLILRLAFNYPAGPGRISPRTDTF
jgi:hypothetical protein